MTFVLLLQGSYRNERAGIVSGGAWSQEITTEQDGCKMKTGLVMEGGAMRGLFTAGVTDVLMENHIEVDGAIGVSAGAAFGCNYISRQPRRVLR